MSSSKTSGTFVTYSAAVLIGMALAYLVLLHDWYWTHHAFICGAAPSSADAEHAAWCAASGDRLLTVYDAPNHGWGHGVLSEISASWFYETFAPAWNSFFEDPARRTIAAGILGSMYAAAWGKVINMAMDYAHDTTISRRGP